jgi:hypothetical protein
METRSLAAEPRAQASPETANRASGEWRLQDLPEDVRRDPAKLRAYVLKLAEEAAARWDYSHEGIPRDSDGVPTYVILPPPDRAYYEERLASFERAWNATKDPAYYRQANTWVGCFRQPHPPWLIEAGDMLAAGQRTPKHDEDYADAQRHFLRYQRVRDHIAAGLDEDRAISKAIEELAKMQAAASWYTVRDSYKKVLRELQANGLGRYTPFVHGRFRTVTR